MLDDEVACSLEAVAFLQVKGCFLTLETYTFSCFMTIEEAMEMNGPLECTKQQFCCSI